VNLRDNHVERVAAIQRQYEAAIGRWVGCNWQTSFGPRKLNLKDMRPHQTRMLADATAGDESTAWNEATVFLDNVGRDARAAQQAADDAMTHIRRGRCEEALAEMQQAVLLEAKYREPVIWASLYDAIRTLAADSVT
jgi:hypothetical protein